MSLRTVVICLLAAALFAPPPRAAAAPRDDAAPASNDWREARELAAAFVRRFRETGDIEPLAAEFFISDFAERAAAEEDDAPDTPMRFLDAETRRRASPAELRRFYLAELNLTAAVVAYMAFRYRQHEAAGTSGEVDEPELIDELPREVAELFKSDGAQVSIAAEDRRERCSHAKAGDATDGDGRPVSEDDCRPPVRTVERMREAASAMERATAALRSLTPPVRKVFEDEYSQTADGEGAERIDLYEPHVWAAGKDYLGFPEGTRIVSVRAQALLALQFRFELVRVDGGLKVLSMEAVLDGD
jgi:hypothetical protein